MNPSRGAFALRTAFLLGRSCHRDGAMATSAGSDDSSGQIVAAVSAVIARSEATKQSRVTSTDWIASSQVLLAMTGMGARSRLDDRQHLSFGDNVVDLDEQRFELSRRRRGDRDFHFHCFDECDVVAFANAATCFHGKHADAPGDFGHDSDLWHSVL